MADALDRSLSSPATATTSSSFPAWLNAKTLSILVLIAAIGVSGYLSYLKISDTQAVCVQGGNFDCGVVLNSIYSEIQGVPIAWLGLATNLIVLSLLALESFVPVIRRYGPVLVFGVVLFAFVYSVYLVYVQGALLQSYCPWCLTHEALITILFGLSVWRMLRWNGGTDASSVEQVGD